MTTFLTQKASGNLVDLYDEIDNIPNGEMLKDRMLSHTIDDVAKKHNFNRETTRRKLKKISQFIKRPYVVVYNSIQEKRKLPELENFKFISL